MTTRKTRHKYPDLAGRGISAARGFAGPFLPPRLAGARSPRHKMRNPTTNRDRNSLRTTTDIHATGDSRSSPGIHAGSGGRDCGSRVDHHECRLDRNQVDGNRADGKMNGKNDRSRSGRVGQRTRPRAAQKRVQKTHAPGSRRRDRQMPWPHRHQRDAVPGLESAPGTRRTPQWITGDAFKHYKPNKPRCGT